VEEVFMLVYKTYGLVGVILVAPAVACIFLWRENKNLTNSHIRQLQVANDKVAAAINQRVVDAQAITNKLVEIVSEQAAVNKETNLALAQLVDKL